MLSTQVLIIGAGPVGMTCALGLAQSDVRCVLVDKRLERLDAPKAHAVNPRTLEICERLGVSADSIREKGASVADGGNVHFVDVLTGARFGTLPYERQDEGARAFTPWPLVNIPQPTFEECLSARLAQCDNVSLLRGLAAEDILQHEDGICATLTGAGLGGGMEISADYAIAADGANSTIRNQLAIALDGPEGLAHYMMVHFEADLTSLTQDRPGMLYFCLSPQHPGAFIGYERNRTWVFMQSFDPATQSRDDFDDATCKQLINAAAGTSIPGLKIRNISPWTMCAQVAERYRDGRVFLVGDAAHRFPPTGGLGVNTGVADAENLSWKIARVIRGQADAALLDSYEAERRPVAEINSHQSLNNSAKLFHLFEALYGPDPENIAGHYAAACADPAADRAVRDAVELQRPHFDSFNLQLGYRYGEAVDPESVDISRYVPRFECGDFLPLIQLQDGPWLLGLLPHGDFALVTGPDGAGWDNEEVAVFTEGEDFLPMRAFHERAGIETSGALMIRPDGHICARWTRLPDQPARAVRECLDAANAGNFQVFTGDE